MEYLLWSGRGVLMSKEKDLVDFKALLHKLETEGKIGTASDVLLDIIAPEEFPFATRMIVQEIISIIDDGNPEFAEMIPKKLRPFFSNYNIFSEGKVSKAKDLVNLIEKEKKEKKEIMMCPECNVAMKIKKFDDPSTGNKYERFQCPKCKNEAPTSKQSWKMKEQQGSQYTIMIDTENEAFGDDPATEIASILKKLVKDLENGDLSNKKLRDTNGNTVGEAGYE